MGLMVAILPGEGSRGDVLIMAGICVAVGVVTLVMWSRQGLYTDAQGVTIKGAFTSQRLAWTHIARFELRDGWWGRTTAVVQTDGQAIAARALNAGRGILPSMTKRAQAQVDELNALLVEARGAVPPTPPERHGPKKLWEYPGAGIAIQGPLVAIAYSAMEPSMRKFMVAYGILSFVGGLVWFWKEKRDERK